MLFGLVFLIPVGGLIIGGIMGGLMGTIKGWGIKDDFRKRAADVLQPGKAALVVFVSKATPDKALNALAPLGGEVLRNSLTEDAEREIQAHLDAQKQAEAAEIAGAPAQAAAPGEGEAQA